VIKGPERESFNGVGVHNLRSFLSDESSGGISDHFIAVPI
jgi:hypothetical protein